MTKHVSASAVALFLLLALSGNMPAQAFGWGYSPYSTGSSLGYLARSVLYGSGLYRGGYGAPGYLVNSLVWNGAYAVGQGINTVTKRNAAASIYQGDPNPRGKPLSVNNPVVDQIALQTWRKPQMQPVYVPQPQGGVAAVSDADMDPAFMPVPQAVPPVISDTLTAAVPPVVSNPANGSGEPLSAPQSLAPQVSNELPPLAPDVTANPDKVKPAKVKTAKVKKPKHKRTEIAEASPPPQTSSTAKSPFAGALVDHINNAFNGDISKALSDKQTFKFAKAVGVVPEDGQTPQIPADRIELVRKILADPADDAEMKVQAVRMLLKH